jgi:hypothetical protein
MLSETVGHGASLTKLMAVESAAPALSEDWVGIDVFAQEVARALELHGLSVIDSKGIVRVSTDAKAVGQAAQAVQGEPIASKDAAVSVLRHQSTYGSAFAFETDPVPGQVDREDPVPAAGRAAWAGVELAPDAVAVDYRRDGRAGDLNVCQNHCGW